MVLWWKPHRHQQQGLDVQHVHGVLGHARIALGVLDQDGRATVRHFADQAFALADDAGAHQVLHVARLADGHVHARLQRVHQRREQAGQGARVQAVRLPFEQVDGAGRRVVGAQGVEQDALQQQVGLDVLRLREHLAHVVHEAEDDFLFLQQLIALAAQALQADEEVGAARRQQQLGHGHDHDEYAAARSLGGHGRSRLPSPFFCRSSRR
jgi:hypothetical protein